jgi:hypothetical protein
LAYHYAIGHGVHPVISRDLAQSSWCITEAILKPLPALVKKSSIYKQEPVILHFVPLNVMNVSFFDLLLLPVSMNFPNIKRSLILFDVLTWTLFGRARPELSENSEDCNTQTLNLAKQDLLCFLTRLGLFPLNMMGGCALLLAFYTIQIWLEDMRQHRNTPQPEMHDLYTLIFIWRALAEVQLHRQSDRIVGTVRLLAPPQILNGSLASRLDLNP